nr:hypothetical protein [uncultured Butyricicoccus sp.]
MARTTVHDIYCAALSILFEEEDSDPDFKRSFPFFLTKMLVEVLPYENQVRQFEGKERLTVEDVPVVTTIDEQTLPFDERFLRTAIPDGIAGLFMADDDSKKAEAVLQYNKYVQACQDIAPAVFEDLFTSEEDDV